MPFNDQWTCPICGAKNYSEEGLKHHNQYEHRTYGVAGQCQAYLMTPEARKWKRGSSLRCKSAAKSLIMPFCGNHVKLYEFIEEIVWK